MDNDDSFAALLAALEEVDQEPQLPARAAPAAARTPTMQAPRAYEPLMVFPRGIKRKRDEIEGNKRRKDSSS